MGVSMRLVSTLAAVSLLCSVSACASYQIAPAPSTGIAARYDHGRVVLLSHGRRSAVAIRPVYRLFRDRIVLAVMAYNGSGYPVNLGYENVRVTDESGRSVHLISADQLSSQAKSHAFLEKVMVSVLSGVDAATISQRATNRYSARVNTSYGTAYFEGRSFNAQAASDLAYQNAVWTGGAMASIDSRLQDSLATIDKAALQTTTIDDKEVNAGLVWVQRQEDASSGVHKMNVEVTYAGDVHHFSFYIGAPGVDMPADQLPAFSHETLVADFPNMVSGSQPVERGEMADAPQAVSYTANRF